MNTYPREKNNFPNTIVAHNLAPVLLLLALLLMLAACGGTTETANVPVADDDVATVEPTGEVVEATVEAIEPTAEAVEMETVVPTAEPATAVPEPTDVPPTEEPTTGTQGLALPEGLCANPYFPVVDGRTYTYQSDVPGMGISTYTFSFANVTPTSFDWVLGTEDAEELVTYTWQCTEEGLLSPNIQLDTGGPGITIETLEAEGITFPAPDMVDVGSTWTTRYVFTTTIDDTGAGAMSTTQTVEMVNEIVAIEPISVPYGDFDEAIKVQSTGTMEMISSLGGVELPVVMIEMNSNTWYVEGVGQVRSEDLSDMMGTGESVVTELLAIE